MDKRIGFPEVIALFLFSLLTFGGYLIANIFMGVIVGALTGWILSLTFLGTWIATGLNAMHISAPANELYQIGAAAGFLSGFFKFSFSSWKRKNGS